MRKILILILFPFLSLSCQQVKKGSVQKIASSPQQEKLYSS